MLAITELKSGAAAQEEAALQIMTELKGLNVLNKHWLTRGWQNVFELTTKALNKPALAELKERFPEQYAAGTKVTYKGCEFRVQRKATYDFSRFLPWELVHDEVVRLETELAEQKKALKEIEKEILAAEKLNGTPLVPTSETETLVVLNK